MCFYFVSCWYGEESQTEILAKFGELTFSHNVYKLSALQWKPGDEEPVSWAEHYRLSPCVPVDYSSVHKAMEVASLQPARRSRRSSQKRPQVRPIRILLRPGTYYLKETVNIEARPSSTVTIETVEMPKTIYQPGHNANSPSREVPEAPVSSSSKSSSSRSLRNLMRCHRPGSVEEMDPTDFMEDDEVDEWWNELPSRPRAPPTRATLILRTRRGNEPAFRIRQGTLRLKNIDISHFSEGLDIWNGNAAIQVQPPMGEDEHPVPVHPRPCGWLDGVHITSLSGRGVVNIDGGMVVMRACAVTDCAATGIYIGGPGSQATVEGSDVVRNGLGNRSRRMGIARGHSGVYLEQGAARIVDCNISSNTLTGISAVSPDNAILTLENCDLMNNGTNQLEMPQMGSFARQQSLLRHNRLSVLGRGRSRSGLSIEPATRSVEPPRRNYLP